AASGVAATFAALFAGCAHTGDAAGQGADDDAREVTVLRERVSRLERRLSDLDAQMALLSQKVADGPRDSISVGTPSGAYAPAPTRYAAPPASSQTWSGYQPVEPTYENEPGTRSIDLGPAPPRPPPMMELPPEEPPLTAAAPSSSSPVSSSSSAPRGDAH